MGVDWAGEGLAVDWVGEGADLGAVETAEVGCTQERKFF